MTQRIDCNQDSAAVLVMLKIQKQDSFDCSQHVHIDTNTLPNAGCQGPVIKIASSHCSLILSAPHPGSTLQRSCLHLFSEHFSLVLPSQFLRTTSLE